MTIDYANLLLLAADTPAQVRRIYMYHLVDAAREADCLAEFCVWLATQRPDLAREITAGEAERATP